MVFVLKDYSAPVARVNNIPVDSLEAIKEWLEYVIRIYSFNSSNTALVSVTLSSMRVPPISTGLVLCQPSELMWINSLLMVCCPLLFHHILT